MKCIRLKNIILCILYLRIRTTAINRLNRVNVNASVASQPAWERHPQIVHRVAIIGPSSSVHLHQLMHTQRPHLPHACRHLASRYLLFLQRHWLCSESRLPRWYLPPLLPRLSGTAQQLPPIRPVCQTRPLFASQFIGSQGTPTVWATRAKNARSWFSRGRSMCSASHH